MMPGMWRAVLFDLDGTLVDSSELHIRACDHALRTLLGVTATRAELLEGMGVRLVDFFVRWAPDRVEALRDAAVAAYTREHRQFIRAYSGVPEMLECVRRRGLATAIVSSKPRRSIDLDLDALGLAAHFTVRIGAGEVWRGKPDPECIWRALVRLHRKPAETLLVGDHVNDVLAARAAGVRVAGALWDPLHRAVMRAAGPDFLLDCPCDINTILGPPKQTSP